MYGNEKWTFPSCTCSDIWLTQVNSSIVLYIGVWDVFARGSVSNIYCSVNVLFEIKVALYLQVQIVAVLLDEGESAIEDQTLAV